QQTRTDGHARRTVEIAGSGDLPSVVDRLGHVDIGPDAARIFVDCVVEIDHPAVAIEEHGASEMPTTWPKRLIACAPDQCPRPSNLGSDSVPRSLITPFSYRNARSSEFPLRQA